MADGANIPPPPAGFTPMSPAPQNAPPPPPAGFTPMGQTPTDQRAAQAAQNWPGMPSPTAPPVQGNLSAQDLTTRLGTQLPAETLGLVKSGVATGAGILNWLNNNNLANHPDPSIAAITHRALQWAQPTSEDQRTGFNVGNVGQLILPGGVLEDVVKGVPFAERLMEAAKTAKIMQQDTMLGRLARIGASTLADATRTATRAGTEIGAQTYIQSPGTPQEAAEEARRAGIAGFVTGGVLGGFGGAGSAVNEEAARWMVGQRPLTQTIAGAPFEVSPRTQMPFLRNRDQMTQQYAAEQLQGLPSTVRDPATQSTDEALGNIAKIGVARSINTANAARAPVAEIIPPSRQLTGGGAIAVGGATEPVPITEGQQIAYDPRKRQIGTRVVEGKGPGEFNLPGYSPELGQGAIERGEIPGVSPIPEGPPGAPYHREPVWQYGTAPRPGQPAPTGQAYTGPGQLLFTTEGGGMDIPRARAQVAQYDKILNDPAQVEEIGPRAVQQITASRADLAEQIRRADNFAASQPHFPLFDPVAAVRATDSLGGGAEVLKGNAGQYWIRADQVARQAGDDVTFTGLRNEEKNIEARMNAKTPPARWDELQQDLKDNQQRQFDFFDRYRTSLSQPEFDYHRDMYQDGIVMGNLDRLFQRRFGGITTAEEARGVGLRTFQPGQGFTQELENFYNDGFHNSATNRDVLMRTIGQDGMDNLKRISTLFDNAEELDKVQGLLATMGSSIRRHYAGLRSVMAEGGAGGGTYGEVAGGGIAGAAIGSYALGHAGAGMVGGMMTAPAIAGGIMGTRRYLIDHLLTDPDFGSRFIYAITNRIPPRVAGPLLAARYIATQQRQQQQQTAPLQPTAAQPGTSTERVTLPVAPPVAATAPRRRTPSVPEPETSIRTTNFTYRGNPYSVDSDGVIKDSSGATIRTDMMTPQELNNLETAAGDARAAQGLSRTGGINAGSQ